MAAVVPILENWHDKTDAPILSATQEVVMRMSLTPAGMAGLLLMLASGPAAAQEMPRALIERAIAAHGGAERLGRLRAEKVSLQGKIFVPGKDGLIPFTADSMLQLPGRFKHVARLSEGPDKAHTLVQIIDGDKVAVTVDDQPQQLPPSVLAELRMTLDLQRAARLVPLLADPAYELAALKPEKVNNRMAFGVKVSVKGHKDLRLYFDNETGLLVKTEHTRDDGSGKEILQEEFYGDFKDFGGFRRWTRIMVFREGKKLMEAELLDVKYLDKIEESEFAKP
jgi:hypothetical protein